MDGLVGSSAVRAWCRRRTRCLELARALNLEVAVRDGGHNVAGHAVIEGSGDRSGSDEGNAQERLVEVWSMIRPRSDRLVGAGRDVFPPKADYVSGLYRWIE
jgi:hypothetical protein